jgi:cyclic beta-1,2-glucan synthetase
LDPCVPKSWKSFELAFKYGAATYRIVVDNPDGVEHGVRTVTVNGEQASPGEVVLVDDGKMHEVRVTMG